MVEVEAKAASDVSDAMAAAAAAAAAAADDTWPEAGGVSPALLLIGPSLRAGARGADPHRAASFSRLIARLLVNVIISCEGIVAAGWVHVTKAHVQFAYLPAFESHSHTNAPRQMSTPPGADVPPHHTPHQLSPASPRRQSLGPVRGGGPPRPAAPCPPGRTHRRADCRRPSWKGKEWPQLRGERRRCRSAAGVPQKHPLLAVRSTRCIRPPHPRRQQWRY